MKGIPYLVRTTLLCDFMPLEAATCTFIFTTYIVNVNYTFNFLAALIRCIVKHCSMKRPDIYYFETIKMKTQAQWKFTWNTLLQLVFSIQNLTRLALSFLWIQNSIDQIVSKNKALANDITLIIILTLYFCLIQQIMCYHLATKKTCFIKHFYPL